MTILDYVNKILTVVLPVFLGTNTFTHVKGNKKLLGLSTSVFSLLFSLFLGIVIKLDQETELRNKNTTDCCILLKAN